MGASARVDPDGALMILLNERGVPDVIEMAVGQNQRDRLDPGARELARHAFRRIETDRPFPSLEDIAVCREVASCKDARGDHGV